jgi:DNA-binding response OmpR family regulator
MLEAAERTEMARKHVFCVNGEPVFLDFVRELFQDANYNVTTTNFVPNTFGQIAALQPDILIVDLVIGHEAGFDLLERLTDEALTRDIPVIAVSTTPDLIERANNEAIRYGTDQYVAKPFDIQDLLAAVQSLIGEG